jgi:phenylacetic acid degradation operon negative regulatory protein
VSVLVDGQVAGRSARSRQPKQLVFAFLGEHILDVSEQPVRATVLIEVLEGAGVTPPATRATLDRMSRRGLLERVRLGREIAFGLTDVATEVLREATARVHAVRPFDPTGNGWTIVTFSLPEQQRTLRHRLRSVLTWAGFAPLRDGLWIAPGEVDLASALGPLGADLPPRAVTAFRATDVAGFPVAVQAAWDVDSIRAEHEAFVGTWSGPPADLGTGVPSPLSLHTMLVADWLALLRADPRLPRDFLDDAWPADQSVAAYRARHAELSAASAAAFSALVSG